jgi:hypothetical protein
LKNDSEVVGAKSLETLKRLALHFMEKAVPPG